MQDGRTILRKGYGLADVELGVPIAPDMVFRIGSTTKQFTAACILKLVEQGRVKLTDAVSAYLPDYPEAGRRATVEQLLTHTSGIHSYTEMPSWNAREREDWSSQQLIAFFEKEPLDFEPGTKWHYDNSGYVLLGAILERVTGRRYEDLVSEWIFRPLGMNDTRYGSDAPIIPRRASGYQKTPSGVENAPYLSMTQPFAAGALVSTVDDLARWQAALDSGKVLSPESLRRWWTPGILPDGTPTRYGYGWGIWTYRGHPVVEHGGSINGFTTANMRLPDDRLYLAVLSNCGGCADVRALALSAASILIGEPMKDRAAVAVTPSRLDACSGTYRDADGDDWIVRRAGDHLEIVAGRHAWAAYPASESEFFLRDSVRTLRFPSGASGSVDVMEIDEGIGPVEKAVRVEPRR